AHRLGAEGPADGVHGIAADIEQTAAAQLRLEADVVRIERLHTEGEGAGDALYRTDAALIQELTQPGGARMVRPHETLHERDAARPAIVDHVPGFGGGRHQRLLAQDVLAPLRP